MIVTAAAVMSLDAKLTRHDEPNIYAWTSKEDQQYFNSLVAQQQAVLLGRGTYEAIRPNLKLSGPTKRIVITSRPEQFDHEAVAGKLEFTAETPSEVVKRLQQQGINKLLIAGGPRLLSELLRRQLVDRLLITIEPRLFGQGLSLLGPTGLDASLRLVESKQLNAQGTLLLTYQVDNE